RIAAVVAGRTGLVGYHARRGRGGTEGADPDSSHQPAAEAAAPRPQRPRPGVRPETATRGGVPCLTSASVPAACSSTATSPATPTDGRGSTSDAGDGGGGGPAPTGRQRVGRVNRAYQPPDLSEFVPTVRLHFWDLKGPGFPTPRGIEAPARA